MVRLAILLINTKVSKSEQQQQQQHQFQSQSRPQPQPQQQEETSSLIGTVFQDNSGSPPSMAYGDGLATTNYPELASTVADNSTFNVNTDNSNQQEIDFDDQASY